jgi:hypothetical protein
MFGYDSSFTSIAAKERAADLRSSYAAGRDPYRSDDADRDSDKAVRPVLASPFGSARNGCDADVSPRAA